MPALPPGLSSSKPIANNDNNNNNNNSNNSNNNNNNNNNSNINNSRNSESEMNKYGIAGLSSLIKMDQYDYTSYALGQDISMCGLDLSKDSEILKNLASPWAETSRSEVEPYVSIPPSIRNENIIPPPGPCDTKIQSFTDETLFYIFYMKPRDTLQEFAARELVARNWRYHKDIQVWLTKDSNVEPVLLSPDVEKGVYIFFDPHNWEKIKKEFVLHYSSVQT